MTSILLPDWSPRGVLPPIDPAAPTSPTRSPYRVSLVELVRRFATSPERIDILRGFLSFRAALHRLGYVRGFQWLDGSFVEDVETLERRPPRDVDVVSFLEAPDPQAPASLPNDGDALDHDSAKRRFKVDGYFVEIDLLLPRTIAREATYWYSIWSHRRSQEWKGFVQIELAPDEDPAAAAALDQRATPDDTTSSPVEGS